MASEPLLSDPTFDALPAWLKAATESATTLYHEKNDDAVKILVKSAIDAESEIGPYHKAIGAILHVVANLYGEMGNARAELVAQDRANYIISRLNLRPEDEVEQVRQRVARPLPATEAERIAAFEFIREKLKTRRALIEFTSTRDYSEQELERIARYKRALVALVPYSMLRGSTTCIVRRRQPLTQQPLTQERKSWWTRIKTARSAPTTPRRLCIAVTIDMPGNFPPIHYPLLKPFIPDYRSGWGGSSNYSGSGTIIVSMDEFNQTAADIISREYDVSEIIAGGPFL